MNRREFAFLAGGAFAFQTQNAQEPKPPSPRLELLSRVRVRVDPAQVIGKTAFGERRIVNILGGRFEGRLSAEVLPGGADWQIVGADGVFYLEARYTIRTKEGALIYVRNTGVRHGSPEVIAQLGRGEIVDPSKYYFRSTPTFETGDSRYAWLNKIIAVGSGARTADAALLDIYEVL